ncbi:MAG: hypothetical protein ACI84D_002632, partial [Thalassolituus oleivorans]
MRSAIVSVCVAVLVTIWSGCATPVQVVPVTSAPVRKSDNLEGRRAVAAEAAPSPYEGIPVGRFDGGKMWTFDNPPLAYFKEAYELDADSAWFAKAQRAALRFGTSCSASFVSGAGLIMTNHHCGRESVTEVQKEGENLLDDGFLASTREEERAVADLYVDKLIAIRDVTTDIYSRDRMDMPSAARAADRERRAEAMGTRLTAEEQAKDSTMVVEIVGLYNGAQYAAYTFRRYDDVRLVMAPELQIGFFGGDVDNFTYPRYNLDMSFFRAYDESGDPVKPEHHFDWSSSGAAEGDAV